MVSIAFASASLSSLLLFVVFFEYFDFFLLGEEEL